MVAVGLGLVTSPVGGTSHESGPGPQASAGYEFDGQGRDLQALLSPMPPRAGGARAGGARAAFYVTESSAGPPGTVTKQQPVAWAPGRSVGTRRAGPTRRSPLGLGGR